MRAYSLTDPYYRKLKYLYFIGFVFGIALIFESCQSVEFRTEEFLKWNLPDSLTQYDIIEIVILDPNDSNVVLDSIFSGKIDSLLEIKPYTLIGKPSGKFTVRIRGFKNASLVYENQYVRQGDAFISRPIIVPPLPDPLPRLKMLSINKGSLSPIFATNSLDYRLPLEFSDSSVQVTIISDFSVTLNADSLVSGISSKSMPVLVGDDTLFLKVYGKMNSVIYKIITKRSPSSESRLRQLVFVDTAFKIAFNPQILDYSMQIPSLMDSINLYPVAMDSQSVITVNGAVPGLDGRFHIKVLVPGENRLEISVIAPDKISRSTYLLKIVRMPSTNALLSVLSISPGTFTKVFQSEKFIYSVNLDSGQNTIGITAIPEDQLATVKVNKIKTQGSTPILVPLIETLTILYVTVFAADTTVSKTYIITVNAKPI